MCRSILIDNFHRRFSSIDITESTQHFPMNLKLHVYTIIRTMFYAYYTNCNVISNLNCVLPTFFRSLSLNVSNVIEHGKMSPLKLLWDRILSRVFWQDRKISGKINFYHPSLSLQKRNHISWTIWDGQKVTTSCVWFSGNSYMPAIF